MNSLGAFSTGSFPEAFGMSGATTASTSSDFTAPPPPVNTGAEQIANLLQANVNLGMTWQQGLEDFDTGMSQSQNLNGLWGSQNTELTSFETNCQQIEGQDYATLTDNGTPPPALPTVPIGGPDSMGASTGPSLTAMWNQDQAALNQYETVCQQSEQAEIQQDPYTNLLNEFNSGSLVGTNGFAQG